MRKINIMKHEREISLYRQEGIDLRISLIRFISFLFIVICHILQYMNLRLMAWFNVGVQVFLVISGYLYGMREIDNSFVFIIKRFKKILVPYYITIFPFMLIEFIFFKSKINIEKAIKILLLNDRLVGGEHLWFVSSIMLCYVLTPVIEKVFENFSHNKRSFVFTCLTILEIVLVFFALFCRFYQPAWIMCYMLGYFIGFNHKKQIISERILFRLFFVLSLQNLIQIYLDYVYQFAFPEPFHSIYNFWCHLNHNWLGILLFLFGIKMFSLIKFDRNPWLISILKISDKYSYEAYLVHQFFILGPFSLMALTQWVWVNIIIIIMCIIICTYMLKVIENLVSI